MNVDSITVLPYKIQTLVSYSHRMDALLGQLNSALATYDVSSFYLTQDGLIYFSEIYSIHNGTP